ncbi:MAG TPA: DUF1800 domain-containing protein, partial [Planctomycetota bacterium]|nr:DUF1800 domain-containing protein [Planctomycetota bacterium]
RLVAHTDPPGWAKDSIPQWNAKRNQEEDEVKKLSSEKERMDKGNYFRGLREEKGRELKDWWMKEMITTDSPLTERMTMFWSNHFTSSLRTIEDPRLMYEQNITLRKGALDNFAFLMRDINTDPAMFYYLDSNSNVAGRPNENYAREVMELFTLGEGKYTEQDIKEAARAFTGYKIDNSTGRAVRQQGMHDAGWKTIMGHKGTFTGDDVVIVLLKSEERVALYIAEKVWKEFVSDEVDEKAVYKLAATFYKAKYDIKKLLKAALMHDTFWNVANRGTLFKSPTELLVGAARALQLPYDDTRGYVQLAAKLGQDIFDPPNVKGWKGSTAWISSESLLSRWEVVEDFTRGKVGSGKAIDGGMMGGGAMTPKAGDEKPEVKAEAKKPAGKKDEAAAPSANDPVSFPLVPKPWIADAKAKGAEGVKLAVETLLPTKPLDAIPESNLDQALRVILHDPTFNLK